MRFLKTLNPYYKLSKKKYEPWISRTESDPGTFVSNCTLFSQNIHTSQRTT